jgi:hypothetical protein
MMQESRLKRGDIVRVRLAGTDDDWTTAEVALASESNPSSVMLELIDGVVRTPNGGLFIGGLPLTVDYEAETVESLVGDYYDIDIQAPSAEDRSK